MKASFKKLFYFLTAFLVVVGMGLSSVKAADETESIKTGSITLNNTKNGITYTPYKIFDVNINGDQSGPDSYGYSISSDSPWLNWLLKNGIDGSSITFLTPEKPAGDAGKDYCQINVINGSDESPNLYYFTVNEGNVIGFANAVQVALTKKAVDPTPAPAGQTSTEDGQTLFFENLPLGYYIISPSGEDLTSAVKQGAIANLTTNAPDQIISPKSTKPTVEKSAKESNGQPTDGSVSVGDVVEFTLKGYVPDTTGYSEYKYTLKDTMTNMTLLIDNSHTVSVTVDGKALENTEDNVFWTSNGTNGAAGLEVSIYVTKLQSSAYIGKEINVTYFATITDSAVSSGANNSVILTYGPDSDVNTDTVALTTTSINVLKVDNSSNSGSANPLAGAKFTLKQNVKDGMFYQGIKESTSVWGSDATEFATDEDGKLVFNGIAAGSYILTETKAPDGFTLLANPIQISVNKEGEVSFTDTYRDSLVRIDDDNKNVVVTNVIGGHLPETGGSGTTMLYVAGGILAAGAAIILVTKKRMEA